MVCTGQKAGLILVLLPPESRHPNLRGVRTEWLVSEWAHWIYPECAVGKVWVLRRYPAPDSGENVESSKLDFTRTSERSTHLELAHQHGLGTVLQPHRHALVLLLRRPQWVVRRSMSVVAPVTSCWRLPK